MSLRKRIITRVGSVGRGFLMDNGAMRVSRPASQSQPRTALTVFGALMATVLLVIGILTPAAADAAAAPAAAEVGTTVKMADLAQFRPGNIISDADFYNSSSMSEAEIQAFLESKVASCRSGYTCLKDYTITTRSIAADPMCAAYSGGGVERASTIIYKVARACGINPQVLLVMLQKEQGLVTTTAPSAWNYRAAMGQGCPDTAACDEYYTGFFNQVYGGARQMKRYSNPPGTSNYFTWYAPGKTWNIQYSPTASCGSAPVYIENQATANLYYYTPYQPNAASLAAGYGEGDSCSSYGNRNFYQYFRDWFAPRWDPNAPIGNLESVQSIPGAFVVSGWAADPNTSDSIAVHVYVDGVGVAVTADLERADVGAAYPALGARHGFSVTVPVAADGTSTICMYGINVGAGGNSQIGCKQASSMTGSPIGVVEATTGGDGSVTVSGWALDPDTTAPVTLQITVGTTTTTTTADRQRTDVAGAFPAYGSAHGFGQTIAAPGGAQSVCVTAVNVGRGSNVQLGCATVTVRGVMDQSRAPRGVYEALSVKGTTVTASGWALDEDTANPIQVRITSGSATTTVTANGYRGDVGAAFPGLGENHGFAGALTLSAGTHDVCVDAINNGAGGDTSLGCKTIKIALPDLKRAPFGVIDAVAVNGSTATVSGWALDLDTADPIDVHIYVGSKGSAHQANKERGDVGAVYPAQGSAHGFSESVSLPAGTSTVCVYAINNGDGGNALLGCRTVQISDRLSAPIGNLESVTVAADGIAISGWAFDRDTKDPIGIHVYVDGVGTAKSTDVPRGDVAAAFSAAGATAGFGFVIPAAPGTHQVCVYAINDAVAGPNTLLGCRTVTK